jgi:DNA-binding MarR family transcriptional regulator
LDLALSDIEIVLRTLPRIHRACRRRPALDTASGIGVSEHQARILAQLDVIDPTMVTELAESLGVTPSTMSLNLKRLDEAGFVTRARDPEDRRVSNIRLTPAGVRVREAVGELDVDRVDAVLRSMSSDDRRLAVQGLVTLAEAADAILTRREGRPASASLLGPGR